MKSPSLALVLIACSVCSAAALNPLQRGSLRELARTEGKVDRMMICCGPTIGLKEIVQFTQLTVEASVARVETGLHEDDGDEYVYTDYFVDVIRTFRAPAYIGARATDASAVPWPFIADSTSARPGAKALHVKLRVTHQGTVHVDGGTITDARNSPTLQKGQHLVLSGYYCREVGEWMPLGIFEVRDGRVIRLQEKLERDYASVDDFAAALASLAPARIR